MIRSKFTVHCDICGVQRGPIFCSEHHAQSWVDDNDDDYAEYGQFCDGVTPRLTDIFHKWSGNKLLCKECVEHKWHKAIKTTQAL